MNASILEPFIRLHLPHSVKISALISYGNRLYVGLSNGDLVIFRKTKETERMPMRCEARSVKSFHSFSEVKRLFQDNESSQVLIHEKTFENVSKTRTAIVVLDVIPLYADNNREVLLIGTADVLQVYEWVGAYLNLVRTFDEIRQYSEHAYVSVLDVKEGDFVVEESSGVARKLFIVTSRKKVSIYQVVHRSRNIFDFESVKEIVLKERIRSVCAFEEQAKVLIATVQTVYNLDVTNDYKVNDLNADSANSSDLAQISSFSYFSLTSSGPQIAIVPLSASEAVFIRDMEVRTLRLGKSSLTYKETKLKVQATPNHVKFLSPCYILFVYPKTFEVVDVKSGFVVQTFKHPLGSGAIFCSHSFDFVTMAAGSNIFQFKVLGTQKQLDHFLSMRGSLPSARIKRDPKNDLRLLGLDRAIRLIEALGDDDEFFTDKDDTATKGIIYNELSAKGLSDKGLKQKKLFLRDLHKEKVVVHFELYRNYHVALVEWASEWMISFHEILDLFPNFLNGNVQINQNKNGHAANSKSIKRITISDLQYIGDTGGKHDMSDSDGRTEAMESISEPPQKIKDFHKAVHGLIVFLTEQRRVHLSFLASAEDDPYIPWKSIELRVSDLYPGIDKKIIHTKLSDYAAAIDTSLFLCYYFTKPLLLGPLLRLPNNRCNARVVNECLLKSSSLDSTDQLTFISQLLDFYFGRSLHDEALRLLNNLAHDATITSTPLKSPSLSIRYMQRLSNEHLDLIFKYSYWALADTPVHAVHNAKLIFMNDSFECEGYDRFRVLDFVSGVVKNNDMAITYLEWLLHESRFFESSTKILEVPKLTTKLCLFYLKEMAGHTTKDGSFESYAPYQKMKALLESNIKYEPWTVLKSIPPGEEKYSRLTVLIYYRLCEHQKSIDILYNQLGDLDEAMSYCEKVHAEPNGKENGQRLLFKLLEDLLMHYNENQDSIARLLTLQGDKMPPLQLLVTLPNSFPLHKLLPHLRTTIMSFDNEQTDTRLKSQLYKVGATKIRRDLVLAQTAHYTVTGTDQKCPACKKPLGNINSVLYVNFNDEIVHHGCLDDLESDLD